MLTTDEKTTGAASRMLLEASAHSLLADGSDVSVVNMHLVDHEGNVVRTAHDKLQFSIL